jgi:hypothetical protein
MDFRTAIALLKPDEREKLLDRVGKIDEMRSGTDKWRAVAHLAASLNPLVRENFEDVKLEVNRKKKELITATGASKSGDIRHSAIFPVGLLQALYAFDPGLQSDMEGRDQTVQKTTLKKLAMAFPEFRVPDKY